MEDNSNANNIIQFPTKKREAEVPSQNKTPSEPTPPPTPKQNPKAKKQKTTLAGAVVAIILASGAVNHYAFEAGPQAGSLDASSSVSGARAIASVSNPTWSRDAQWELQMSESLASVENRTIASTRIGHDATLEERLRFGTIDDVKYTIYKPDARRIQSITLQGEGSEPSYIGDREKFLDQYGKLLNDAYASASLKSVQMNDDRMVEKYTLFDKDKHAQSEVHFSLDKHKRLISLVVEPVQI